MMSVMCGGGGGGVVVLVVVLVMRSCTGQTSMLLLPTDSSNQLLDRYPDQDDYMGGVGVVMAGVGGRADLPCNMTSPLPRDPPLLVLWYKSGIYKPIYSVDLRSVPPTHWKNPSVLGNRATFHPTGPSPHPPSLVIQRVGAQDQATYRCRVNFKTSPTLTFLTNLTVIVPPRRLSVYTDLGVEARSIVGPFTEGDTLRLTCRATGGSPPPTVTWWEGASLQDMTSEVETLDFVSNTLIVTSLTRRDLHRTLTCQATNSNFSAPLLTTVTLDMNFPPLWVRLRTSREPLSAGRGYVIVCQAAGARPPASLIWRLAGAVLTTHEAKLSHEGNVTTSELRLTPEAEDAGKVLTCQAQSPAVPKRPIMDDWRLDVYYVPQTTLRPGRSLNLTNIEEGDDIYFECSIKANPWVYKVVWLHQDHELHHNVSGGVIISNQSLVLQRVARTASGHYYCLASNIEGDGKSNPVHLKVKYSPVCRDPGVTYHGAARLEQVNIPCHLDAHPRPLTYRWTFNNSGESVDIPREHIQAGDYGSTVSYTPNTELDYGTLLCWGSNAVGHQRRPCVFHVFPAGRPDPVHNCSSYNLSVAVVNVRCVAGFDGGLPQTFILELVDPGSKILVANTTSQVPRFQVDGLASGLALQGRVYSTNTKGRSQTQTLRVYTLKEDLAEKRTAAVKPSPVEEHSGMKMIRPVLAVILGVVGGLMLVVVLICILVKLRFGRRQQQQQQEQQQQHQCGGREHHQDSNPPKLPLKVSPTILHEVATPPPPPDSPRDSDEKNPDVIPQAESESWSGEGVHTISSASLPSTYTTTTLPRGHRMCTHPPPPHQGDVGGEVVYSELSLGTTTTSPQHRHLPTPPHHRLTQQQPREGVVVYATLDHKRGSRSQPYPNQHHPGSYQQSPSGAPSSHPGASTSLVGNVGSQGPQSSSVWTPSPPVLGRRHSLRRDTSYSREPEASVPLIPNQKESSV